MAVLGNQILGRLELLPIGQAELFWPLFIGSDVFPIVCHQEDPYASLLAHTDAADLAAELRLFLLYLEPFHICRLINLAYTPKIYSLCGTPLSLTQGRKVLVAPCGLLFVSLRLFYSTAGKIAISFSSKSGCRIYTYLFPL
ncbi:hypothetical protein AALB16_06730 [Lachnospiraceae bacterium 62-35]